MRQWVELVGLVAILLAVPLLVTAIWGQLLADDIARWQDSPPGKLVLSAAVIGVLAALTAVELERAREFGVLRAQGMTPAELVRLMLTETGLLGLAAGLLAMPLGASLSALLVYVINRRSFGWSMDLVLAPRAFAIAGGLAVAAALLAGLLPAWRIGRVAPVEALRAE